MSKELTEQFNKNLLLNGYYYLLLNSGEIAISKLSTNIYGVRVFSEIPRVNIKEVLGKVPSYNEYSYNKSIEEVVSILADLSISKRDDDVTFYDKKKRCIDLILGKKVNNL